MSEDLLRHYRFVRRTEPPDMSHPGERGAHGARPDRWTSTPAYRALEIARYRIEARDALMRAGHPDVAASYDETF